MDYDFINAIEKCYEQGSRFSIFCRKNEKNVDFSF